VASAKRKAARPVSAKLPSELLVELDRIAAFRGVTRSFLLRELAEAAVEGRVLFKPPPRSRGMTLAELGASSVGKAVRKRAQLDAEAACRDGSAARDVEAAAQDLDAVARRAARLVAEGR
jgi:hypothetical protein